MLVRQEPTEQFKIADFEETFRSKYLLWMELWKESERTTVEVKLSGEHTEDIQAREPVYPFFFAEK